MINIDRLVLQFEGYGMLNILAKHDIHVLHHERPKEPNDLDRTNKIKSKACKNIIKSI